MEKRFSGAAAGFLRAATGFSTGLAVAAGFGVDLAFGAFGFAAVFVAVLATFFEAFLAAFFATFFVTFPAFFTPRFFVAAFVARLAAFFFFLDFLATTKILVVSSNRMIGTMLTPTASRPQAA